MPAGLTLVVYGGLALFWAAVLEWGIRGHVRSGHGATDAFRAPGDAGAAPDRVH